MFLVLQGSNFKLHCKFDIIGTTVIIFIDKRDDASVSPLCRSFGLWFELCKSYSPNEADF